MRAIFISYRRDDSEGHAGRLYDDLTKQFGSQSVFMDVAGIHPGLDFRNVINDKIASCGVLLAVIGPGWLDAKDESGRRRLDNPADFVRLETVAALKRGIPVVPVLVHGARMPKPEQLPEDLDALAYRNAVELTHARWESDIAALAKSLDPLLVDGKPARPAADHESGVSLRGKLAVSTAAVLAIIAIAAIIYRRGGSPAPTIKSFSASPTEVKENGTVTIRWDVLNADSVELEPFGQQPPSGRVADSAEVQHVLQTDGYQCERGEGQLCAGSNRRATQRFRHAAAFAEWAGNTCEPTRGRLVGGSAQRCRTPDAFENRAKWK